MLELLFIPFFQRALLVGIILGFLMAIVGVFIILRRMSLFSDAIGHAALTGIAIGLLMKINPYLSALAYSLLVAVGISYTRLRSKLPIDTLLGVFFSGSIALGVILVQMTPGYQSDLLSFLFGDILAVNQTDVYITFALSIIALIVVLFAGKSFIAITFDPDLARAEGIRVNSYEMLFLLLLAGVVALAIKLVGVALVTAMLIIPAATASNVTRSLAALFVGSVIVSLLSIVLGMFLSAALNTASGPTIVLVETVFFTLSLFIHPFIKSA